MNTSSITDPLQKCTSASQAENFDTGANDDEEKEARFTDPVPRPDDLVHDRMCACGMSAISVQNNNFSFSSPTFAADNTLYESSMMMDSIDLSGSISCCLQNRFHDPEDNINPFGFYLDDPINNALTAKNLCAPCHNNESKMGEGAMTEINEYERIYLYGLFSHGSCAPQNHNGNLERKPIARDSISFQSSNSSSQYATKEDKVPTQYLNSRDKYTASPVPGSSTLYSLSESFNPDWNRTEAQVKSNAPPVVKRRSLTSKLLKPVPFKTHKKHSEKVKDIPKGSNHTRSKSAIKFQTRDVVAKLPLAHQQIIEKARTTRKQDALRTWFQRLNDLMKFRDENGHGKWLLFDSFFFSFAHSYSPRCVLIFLTLTLLLIHFISFIILQILYPLITLVHTTTS